MHTVSYLSDIEVECILEVLGLCDDEQVEAPAAAEVGDDDGIHGHGGEELLPRGIHELDKTKNKNKL